MYVLGSTDPDNLGHIKMNLCPFFGQGNAKVTVQSVSTVANMEILNEKDYIEFDLPTPLKTQFEVVLHDVNGLEFGTEWPVGKVNTFMGGDILENTHPDMTFKLTYPKHSTTAEEVLTTNGKYMISG
jgi:hypothetical protein